MKKCLLFVLGLFCTYLISSGQKPNLVKNINPTTADPYSHSDPMTGVDQNYPDSGIFLSGRLYFPAYTYNGIELWMSNKTTGTSIVKDIADGGVYADANPMNFNLIGNQLYFFTADW